MTPSAEKIQRYVHRGYEYVLFTDHAAALERARAEAREELKRELEALLPKVCADCAAGLESDGGFDHMAGHQVSEDDWEPEQIPCQASSIRARLDALAREAP